MCAECGLIHCSSGCPNASEPQVVFCCSDCGDDICDGEDYYHVAGDNYCETCVDSYRKTAEFESEEYEEY